MYAKFIKSKNVLSHYTLIYCYLKKIVNKFI